VRENERNVIKRRSKPVAKNHISRKIQKNNNMEFVKGKVICILQ